jgi:formylglycine-generating enzyme required for sulfatase activity
VKAVAPIPNPPAETSASGWQGVKAGDLKIVAIGGQEIRFRWCPPSDGLIRLGSPIGEEGRNPNEDQVSVTIPHGFWMQETEVTQGLWRVVMPEVKLDWSPWEEAPNLPVYNVDYQEAKTFAENLTGLLRDRRLLPGGLKISLPTEVRWEYAARAGTTTRFPFGDDEGKLEKYAWYEKNSGGRPHVVGTRDPNPWKLRDMLGNVAEWCANAYSERIPNVVDPRDPPGASPRVIRGGSWFGHPRYARPACRDWITPAYRYINLGFRVAAVWE